MNNKANLFKAVTVSSINKLFTKGISFLLNFYVVRIVEPSIFGIISSLEMSTYAVSALVLEPIRTFILRNRLMSFFIAIWYGFLRPPSLKQISNSHVDNYYLFASLIDLFAEPFYSFAQNFNFIWNILLAEGVSQISRSAISAIMVKGNENDSVVLASAHFMCSVISMLLLVAMTQWQINKAKQHKIEKLPITSAMDLIQLSFRGSSSSSFSEFRAALNFITKSDLKGIVVDALCRFVLGFGEGAVISRVLTLHDAGVLSQAQRLRTLFAMVFLAPMEQRVFEAASSALSQKSGKSAQKESTGSENEQQSQKSKGKQKKSKEMPSKNDSASISKAVVDIAETSIKLAFLIGALFFPFAASISSEMIYVSMGRKWMKEETSLLCFLFLSSLPLLALNGVFEALVRAVSSSSLMHINNTIMAGASVMYIGKFLIKQSTMDGTIVSFPHDALLPFKREAIYVGFAGLLGIGYLFVLIFGEKAVNEIVFRKPSK
ncbi:putative Multi Antimicrobial Extrusion (MATE) Family Protein [Monocercomonoides exilis]|uniref:putative Multi Antimicrobial Extrusion (MATE) Family Protein n=1 Tax=Monocercomonoides exilis TaxID=2049356 RepID=UPI003559CEEF|nr:putative Multi Antimicrobial Extrusion (MATE) Family Protein [Monocercomonoides exilis]|eukprot:MONOS_6539.1-p1 / transcript=MONOS_6539.1 / gene=MONOS_6539 / organism=Monocercomonoides_exilis_PA203 / gene_product=Multi Antimicrobial Extrusion (MATE) Family Protein / transcript_product=Multi Antimicrobial Extrusion (MATE) Family Protein / location=Mono_scaffold00207:54152-56301(-) / protein_length=490 / sequence_SO=supercontig / SO=protein_coding / is_pseudo=false